MMGTIVSETLQKIVMGINNAVSIKTFDKYYFTKRCFPAVDGGWSEWSKCDKTCGGGSKTRSCTNPVPVNDGRNCFGNSTEDCINNKQCREWVRI